MPDYARSPQKTKKRKHATEGEEPSAKRSKTDLAKNEPKVDKKERKEKKSRDKGKARADEGQFKVINATLNVTVPPVFAQNIRGGVQEMLDSMIMRYIPAVQGVILAHDGLRFLEPVATIKADCPFANCQIAFAATVWSPQIGMKLVGKVNLCSPDHVSLLLHRTFNVSIPRHHIPTENWAFEYGPAENDPEFGAEAAAQEGDEKPAGEDGVEGSGRWIHKVTGDKLGGEDGYLEFTVIGLTIANQMLSLVGSIQPDPFSAEHVPERTIFVGSNQRPSSSKAAANDGDANQMDPSMFDETSESESELPDVPLSSQISSKKAKKDTKNEASDAAGKRKSRESEGGGGPSKKKQKS
ncbi:hypothetical protein K474DRAFT_1667564 [Panus rudis PR-1116 ss-1]|nr:hypothetical protein K474DRAFT_1667564 [Panus rudis PR-1116 ss-1]